MARWDWYQATVRGLGQFAHDEVLAGLVRGLDLVSAVPSRAMHGYLHGAEVRRGSDVLARVWWGGNPGVHVQATGEHSPEVARVLRQRWPVHAVTRCDASQDWNEPGLFGRMAGELLAYAADRGIRIDQQGDWHRGEARTLYLGARSSPVQLVLYEKGYQVGAGAPLGWVRLEVRVRPVGDARERVALWEPDQAFGASAWLVEALQLLGWDHLVKRSVGTVWRPADDQRARLALVRQYSATLAGWIAEAGGLDAWWGEFVSSSRGEAVHSPQP